MKCPSSRNSLPNETLSCTSTAWCGERNFSNSRADRMKNAQSSLRYSAIAPGAMSPGRRAASLIAASAPDRLEALALGLQHGLERREQPLGLVGVVRGVVAHVDVHRDEAGFGPRVDGDVRLGQQHRSRDALRLELEEALADNRQVGGLR